MTARAPNGRKARAARLRGAFVLACALLAVTGKAYADAEPRIRPWQDGESPLAAHLTPGGWTLVMFWSVTCVICASEAPTMSALHEEEESHGVALLGVSIDGTDQRPAVARWMQRHQMRFPTLLGDLRGIAAYFEAAAREPFRGTPTFMIFDPRGRLVGVNAGPVRAKAVRDFIARKARDSR